MKQCKPCITIRTTIKLLWKCYVVDATKNFKKEYTSLKTIGAVVCILPTGPIRVDTLVTDIRNKAKENYDPIRQEQVEQYIKDKSISVSSHGAKN